MKSVFTLYSCFPDDKVAKLTLLTYMGNVEIFRGNYAKAQNSLHGEFLIMSRELDDSVGIAVLT